MDKIEQIKSEIKRRYDSDRKKHDEYQKYEIWGEIPKLRGRLEAFREMYTWICNM